MTTPFRQLESEAIRRAIHGIGCVIACTAAGASRNLDLGGPGRTAILPMCFNRSSGSVLGLAGAPFVGLLFDSVRREQATWLLAQAEVLIAWDAPEVRQLLGEALPQVGQRPWISVSTMIPWPEEGLRHPDLQEASAGLGMELDGGPLGEAEGLLRLIARSRPNRGEPFLLELLRRVGMAEA